MKHIIGGLACIALAMLGLTLPMQSASADAEAGTSAGAPIVVTSPTEVPEGAVEDEVSTYVTEAKCDVTRSWVLTTPGSEAVTHTEYRWSVLTREDRYRWSILTRTFVPEHTEVVHHDAVYGPDEYLYTNKPLQGVPEEGKEEKWYAEGEQPGGFVKVQPEQSRPGEIITEAWDETVTIPASYTPWKWTAYTEWGSSSTPPEATDTVSYGSRYHQYTNWKWTRYTEWQASTTPPEITDDLTSYGSRYERTVTDTPATPDVTTYYAWSDGAECPPGVIVDECPNGDLSGDTNDGKCDAPPAEPTCETDPSLCPDENPVTPEEPEKPATPVDETPVKHHPVKRTITTVTDETERKPQAGPEHPAEVLPNTGGPEIGAGLLGLALLAGGALLMRRART